MAELINIDDKIEELKNYFSEQDDMLVVYIFGSYGTEYQTPLSDVDFAVLFKQEAEINLMREMEIMSQITLITKVEDIDLVNLNQAPVLLQHKAIKEGKLIFEREENKVSEFIEYVLTYYYDAKIRSEVFNQEYRESLEEEYGDDQQS